MLNSYRLVVQANNLDNTTNDYEFDTIEDPSVEASSTVSTHPTISGDMTADHMFRDPTVFRCNGSFALSGNQVGTYSGTSDRLSAIQDTFENIKNNALFCSLITINKVNSQTLFKTRHNMVLQSMTWTQHQNSLDFSFTFKEALITKVDDVNPVLDTTDSNLPEITDPVTLDFTDTLVDFNDFDKMIIQVLRDNGLVENDFLMYASSFFQSVGAGTAGYGVAIGGAVLGAVIVALCATGTIPGIGWVVAAAGMMVVGLYVCVSSFIKEWKKNQYAIQAFKDYKNDVQNQQEVERFSQFFQDLHDEVDQLENYIKLYGIAKNVQQECALYIGSTYYVFTFTKNNTTGYWSLTITDISNQQVRKPISSLEGLESTNDCKANNTLFTKDGVEVYCINKALYKASLSGKVSQEDSVNYQQDLTNMCILVSAIKMEDFNTTLTNIVRNAIGL